MYWKLSKVNLPGLITFVDWGCGNLKVFVDGGSLLEIITATGGQKFYNL